MDSCGINRSNGIHSVLLLSKQCIPISCHFIKIMNLSIIIDLTYAKTAANHFTGFNNSKFTWKSVVINKMIDREWDIQNSSLKSSWLIIQIRFLRFISEKVILRSEIKIKMFQRVYNIVQSIRSPKKTYKMSLTKNEPNFPWIRWCGLMITMQ